MEIYASRLASFHLSSRKKPKWPHIRPTPKDLADAGFYHDPYPSSNDNVVCFLCKKALDGWNADDNPVKEHFQHSQQCGWAILKYIKFLDNEGASFTDKELQDAREATFGSWWPHEQKRGWLSKIKKMSQAGFYYNPTPDSDDMVSCIYCGLGLDGWEPKDDPMEEHKKRAPLCLFFQQFAVAETIVLKSKSSNKAVRNTDILDNSFQEPCMLGVPLKSKTKNSFSKTKNRSVVKKSTKKSKDNSLLFCQEKSPPVLCEERCQNISFKSPLESISDNLILDKSMLIEQKSNNDKFINNFSPLKKTRMTRLRTNSLSNKSGSLYVEKETTNASKLRNMNKQSFQIEKENDLGKFICSDNYKNNESIDSGFIKKHKDENTVDNEQNDVSIKLNECLAKSMLNVTKDGVSKNTDSEELQNAFVATKTVLRKGHRKTSSVKSIKSEKIFLKKDIELNCDNIEKKNVLNTQGSKIEKRCSLRSRKIPKIDARLDKLIEDDTMFIGNSCIEKNSKQVLKKKDIVNLEGGLKNTSQSELNSFDVSLQSINERNSCEKSDIFLKQGNTFDSTVNNGFGDTLQQNSKEVFGFNTSESLTEKAKNIFVSEIFSNNDIGKTIEWVPINIQTLVYNSSDNVLGNPYELSATELDMTIEEWIKFITRKQAEKLEVECQKMISFLKKEGERARQAILSIHES
ncbi:hypothetical protein PORY_000357 [Pneumocystis oryctolagi]|uniref:Uncharacterized protein n=1 Tax=Pneumocystis oryctolagi TaxID=42067 RepID=A0ACB7CF20_9ASCO|nr:hypothetical protein PORY_000357 [Pneumocystis oryctolagi]